MLIKRNKDMIRFAGRRHTRLGVISAVIGIAVVLGFFIISVLSGVAHGNGGQILGVVGLILFALAVFGFVLSYKAFKQKDIFYRFPLIGIVLNGIMTTLFFILYVLGTFTIGG